MYALDASILRHEVAILAHVNRHRLHPSDWVFDAYTNVCLNMLADAPQPAPPAACATGQATAMRARRPTASLHTERSASAVGRLHHLTVDSHVTRHPQNLIAPHHSTTNPHAKKAEAHPRMESPMPEDGASVAEQSTASVSRQGLAVMHATKQRESTGWGKAVKQ